MAKNITVLLLLLGAMIAHAQQTGSIQGRVTDAESGEPLIGANVALYQAGTLLSQGGYTDIDGNYSISPLDAGEYDLEFSYVGYQTVNLEKVRVSAGGKLEIDQQMGEGTQIKIIDIIWVEPLLKKSKEVHIDGEIFMKMPNQDIIDIAKLHPKAIQVDNGRETNSGGARGNMNDIIIEGVRIMSNSTGVSNREVEQAQIIAGGVPASIGDVLGVTTNFTLRKPGSKFGGYAQFQSSQLTDQYQSNRLDWGINGPLLFKKLRGKDGKVLFDPDKKPKRESILGYRLSGILSTSLDFSPSAIPFYKIKDEKLEELRQNPMAIYNGNLVSSASYVQLSDMDRTPVRPNNRDWNYSFSGNLFLKLNKQMNLKASGQFEHVDNRNSISRFRMFNFERNPILTTDNWRVGATFNHYIPNNNKAVGLVVENAAYSAHIDYSQVTSFTEDLSHKGDFFKYGYVGKFNERLKATPEATFVYDQAGVVIDTTYSTGFLREFTGYEGNTEVNPLLENYNSLVGTVNPNPQRGDYIMQNGLFGSIGSSVFGLYDNAGVVFDNYLKSKNEQIGVRMQGGFEVAKKTKSTDGDVATNRHKLSFGVVFEQRINRFYNLNPVGLWQIADLRANQHISVDSADVTRISHYVDMDVANGPGMVNGPVFEPFANMENMTEFGRNLRRSIGFDERKWVNVLGLHPNQMNMGMFAPDDILNQSVLLLNYSGYDFHGNEVGTNVTFNDFFKQKDVNGNYTRKVAPFAPIYTGVYLEDEFSYKKMNFRLGLRLDRYDANAKVLKDPYLLFGTKTASDLASSGLGVPSTVPGNAAVYTSNTTVGSSIIGYRSGDQWYDADGVAVNNSSLIAQGSESGLPIPMFTNPNATDTKSPDYDPNGAFKDYEAKFIFQPRLAFSFPIGDMAEFFAHYDVLTRRPTASDGYASPLDYFNFGQMANNGNVFGNPALAPQQTVDYEVGYQQAIGTKSSISISVFYREFRNLIQARKYFYAYPVNSYESFANNDFSTTKGLTLQYDLRRTGNIRMLAGYTLSFADGTGSSSTSNRNITSVVNPFIRQTFPLEFDTRHKLNANIDYRFGKGKGKIGKWAIFENAGVNLDVNLNSGQAFTRKKIATMFGGEQTEGTLNGSRLPWNFRLDLRLDKDFTLGKKEGKQINMNVYFLIQNLLNTRNVLGVYSATADPNDDGYLRDLNGTGPSRLANFEREYGENNSFSTLYQAAMINPSNFSMPTRFYVGVSFDF